LLRQLLHDCAMSHSKALSILTLFLLNVGGLAANSPMRRSISVDADGKTTELQSLIDLANILPGEETEATQSLLMLAANTPPGSSKDAMLAFISDLKAKVTSWYSDATTTLEKSIDPIRQCATTKEDQVTRSLTQKDTCTAKSDEHTVCRKEESELLIAAEHLKAQMAEKKEIMDTECKIFSDVEAEAKAATASYGGGDEESYLERVCDEFGGLLPRYEDAKEKCTTAKAEHVRVSGLYEKAHTKYTLQVTTCNAIQIKLDVVCCKYALVTKDTCDSYGTCYEERVAEHNSLKEELKREAGAQEVAWRVFKRIECLLPLLGTDDHEGIELCRKNTHQDPHSIGEPAIPPQDSCTVEAAYPGTDGFYTAHYAPLPDNAKGEPVAKCVGMGAQAQATAPAALPSGSNMAAPSGYVAKAGSAQCRCRGSGWGLDSCGSLCCAASPYTDPDPSGKYYYGKNGKTEADMCYERAATQAWTILTPDTTFGGPWINFGTPLPVTLKLHQEGDEWMLGLVEGPYLKLVKIRITGETTHEWIATRYDNTYDRACAVQVTFTLECFKGTDPAKDAYPVSLKAKKA